MARVTLYERTVNAVHTMTHIGETHNKEIQDGMKIKEELVDTTTNINITDNYKFLRSRSKMSNSDKSLLSENNDVPHKHVKHETIEILSDDHSEDSDGSGLLKIVNLKSKSTRNGKEHISNTSPIPKKKRKYCDNVSTNDYTNTSKATIKNFNRKRKGSKSSFILKNKIKTNIVNDCDVCFIKFRTSQNRKLHHQYYTRIGNFKCRYCKESFTFLELLRTHVIINHRNKSVERPYMFVYCHFCNRPFRVKAYLQSHLFHAHSELIYINKIANSKITPKDTSCKDETLTNDMYEESLCSSDHDESKESSTTLTKDHEQSRNDDTVKIDHLIEEPSNEEMSLTKKLRQPTLNEYLELYKRKRNIKSNLNQLDTMKGDYLKRVSNDDERVEESLKQKFPKEAVHDEQIDISTEKSSNDSKQMTQVSTLEQDEKHAECSSKEPFVKLHADVETMKCFLGNLSDENVKNEVIQNQANTMMSSDSPYSLRPVRAIRFLGHLTRRYVFKKLQHNTRNSTAMEQHVTDLDTANSEPAETITVPPKYKDFTITLERCDKKLRNRHTTQTTFEQELVRPITEPNTQSEKNNIKNDVVLKELEVSLERLKTEDNLGLEMDVEKQNNNIFTCGICKKSLPKSAKRMHMKSSHVAYMSSICNARYTMRHKLLQHYLREHTFKPNQCCVCNEICDPTQLKQHLTYHCLKYFQNEDDQYPINIDIKCSIKASETCFKCGKTFPSRMLWSVHDRYCRIRGEVEEVQQDFTETNISSEVIPQANYNEDVDESTVTHDEKIQPDASCESPDNKSVEKSNQIQITPANEELVNNEEEMEIIEEPTIIEEDQEINGSNQNPLSRKTIFIVENMLTNQMKNVSIAQPNKSPNTKNSAINDQTTASAQSNITESNGKTYPCDICGKRFQSKKNLEQHIRSFSRVTEFCPLCNTAFSSKRFLQTHIAAAHVPQLSKNYDFHCVFCNQGFLKKYDLRPHVLHLHGRQMLETIMPNFRGNQGKDDDLDNGNATCSVCNLAFETLDRYVEHRMYYYKNHKFRCSVCLKDFQGMYMYHHHNKLIHYPEDKRKSYSYTCNICKEGFNHELHFHSHNMHVHCNEETLPGTTDLPRENNQITIDVEEDGEVIDLSMNQQKKVQSSSTDYTCQICQFKCTDANDLENHELFYTNDGDFKCDVCSRRCKTIDLLNQHKNLTHICGDIYKEYICKNCGEVLTSITSLKCHEKHFHNSLSLDNANNCKDCGQTFSSSIECKEHQCKSTSNKSQEKYIYRCFYCDMKFISLDTIQTHIIHVHFNKLLTKHAALKSDLFIVSEDKTQKKSIPQLIDQVIVSRQNLTRSFQQSGNDLNGIPVMQETQDKVAVEPTPDQLKPLFLIDNDSKRKTPIPAITASGSETNISTTMEKEQDNQAENNIAAPASTESTNKPQKNQFLSDTFAGISLEQMLDGHSIFTTGSTNKSSATFPSVSSKPVNGPNVPTAVATIPRNEEITLQKCVSVNGSTEYACPLCPLQYPSLMYFHAHLRFAHADLIRNDLIYPQLDQLSEKIPAIECLLCPRISTDEKRYKRHLQHSHSSHLYLTNSKVTDKNSNASTFSTTPTNSTRSKSPEVITVEDDDDDDNSKNSLVEQTAVETSIEETKCTSNTGNENIGKLKVKPFAKIIENLAIDRAIELLNTPQLNSTRDDVPTK